MTLIWTFAARTGAVLALAAAAVCCGGGGLSPSPAGSSGVWASAPASALPSISVPSPSPSAAPTATGSVLPAAPPAATLRGRSGEAAAGSLGTYTWGGGGSDAPWIVGKPAGAVAGGTMLDVTFAGPTPASWTAAWAKVRNGTASTPVDATAGSGAATLKAPEVPGDWSARVTAIFGPGSSATYYWRFTVTP